MLPMRTPDEDGSGEDAVSTSVGDGFGASADDLEDGFGDDDFSDDTSFGDGTGTGDTTTVDTDEGSFGDDTDTGGDGGPFGDDGADTPFGDGLSDAEAENVLVEILEDVFGTDNEALDEVDTGGTGGGDGTGSGDGGLFEAFDGASDDDGGSFVDTFNDTLGDDGAGAVVDDAFDPFEPTDIPSGDDFDLTRDGRVDVHDLHEAAHPFDFGISE